ncbi:MAG: hypothetical protein ACJ8FY_28050 [Gemmataceae bacterium]
MGLKFYVLRDPITDSPEDRRGGMDVIEEESFKTGPAPLCPKCAQPVGLRSWLPPYRVEMETWGSEYGDLVRLGNNVVVSDRFVRTYQKADLKGLSPFEPVEVIRFIHRRGKPKEPPPTFFTATVPRSQTTVDQEKSEYQRKKGAIVCPVCLQGGIVDQYKRVCIVSVTWTGEDIFFPRGGLDIVVTETFKEAFEQHSLRGSIYIPAEECGWDAYAPL